MSLYAPDPPKTSAAPASPPHFSSSRQDSPARKASSPESPYTAFLPVLLITLTLLFWSGFQTVQLVMERAALKEGVSKQELLLQNANKMRASLYAIALQTKKLAEQGNPNARFLVDEWKKQGMTINPPSEPSNTAP